jgi:hypothetical protein
MGSGWAQATKYQEVPVAKQYEDIRAVNRAQQEARAVLQGKVAFATGQKKLTDYYTQFLFRAMTQEKFRPQLAEMRRNVVKDLQMATSDEAHRAVRDLAYKYCRILVSEDAFHPAVRYNAMLLIGSLNEQEAVFRGTTQTPPVPYKRALEDVLLRALDDPKTIEPVRIAALIGLNRHAQICGAAKSPEGAAERETLISKVLPIATAQEKPPERSPEGHEWMRRLAVEALGQLRTPGKDGQIVAALSQILTDKANPLGLRCAAAESLGRLNYEGTQVDAAKLAEGMGVLASDCCRYEIETTRELLRGPRGSWTRSGGDRVPSPRGDASSVLQGDILQGPGGRQEIRDEEQEIVDPATIPSRRRLLHRLLAIKRGLDGEARQAIPGIAKLAGAGEIVASVASRIDEMIKILNDPKPALADMLRNLYRESRQLANLVAVDDAGSEEEEETPQENRRTEAAAGAEVANASPNPP